MKIKPGIWCLLLVFFLPAVSWAQSAPGIKAVTLAEKLEVLDAALADIKEKQAQLRQFPEKEDNITIYRRIDRGLLILRSLHRLTQDVAGLPEDDPARNELIERLGTELTGVISLLIAGTETLDRHISRVEEEMASASGTAQLVAEANLYSLRKRRIEMYLALADVIESQRAIGLPVEKELGGLVSNLYEFAEALAGRLEYSGATLEGLRVNLRANPGNADLVAAESIFVGEHNQDLERLASISKMLGRLEFDNARYQSLLLEHGQSVSVRDLDSALLGERLRDIWDNMQSAVTEETPDFIFRLIVFFLMLLVFYYLSRLARRAVALACERSGENLSQLLKDMLASVSGAVVLGIGFLMALSHLGISLAPMLAGLGVAGFIVGFALQDTLGNFAAGGMILIYRPYDVGDVVEVATVFGVVKKMSLVSTTITTFDNQTLVIPNSKIWGDVIKNVTAQRVRRVDMEFGIGYGDDIEKAEAILHDIVESHDKVLSSPEAIIKVHTLGDSSVNFVVRPWVKTVDYWDVYWDVTREIKLRFDREGVSIPFPQRDVHIYQEEG